ncbi:MurR/RpiR family transcriptional regulator [Fundicoccus culcitae]|uniref:MurR/RpiR family transcriptional regulator n=1 Tax=Fundicoccus culcitae TaxID=2969821 RepID=A0ABY5P9H0_9LACT|nr:MurR/RpiR family transcriptional regulator [Fundicoccus culcitae]UUX35174.1 MurR/RpiR family transcriptional regulator [Fundicoccus culcitae]
MSCTTRIRELYDSFSETELKIADFILDNRESVLDSSTHELADLTKTSASSWVRFSKKLGYKGFTALKVDLASDTVEKPEENQLMNVFIDAGDSFEVLTKKVQYISMSIMEKTYNLLNIKLMSEAVDAINKSNRIFIIGIGGSAIMCNDLMQKLSRIGRTVFFHDDSHILLAQLANLTPDDIVIAVSYSGKTDVVLYAAEKAKEVGTPVIAITKYDVKTSLSQIADFNLYIPVEETNLRLGTISSRNATFVITDLLYYGVAKDNFDDTLQSLVASRKIIDNLKQ